MIRDNIQPSNGDNLFGGVMRTIVMITGPVGFLMCIFGFMFSVVLEKPYGLNLAMIGVLITALSFLIFIFVRKRT